MYVQQVCVCERGFHISVPGSSCTVLKVCLLPGVVSYLHVCTGPCYVTKTMTYTLTNTATHLQFLVALAWWLNISCMTHQLLLTVYEALSIYVIVGGSRWTAWLTAWLTSYGRLLCYCFGYNSLPSNQLQTHTVTIHPGRSSVCFICCFSWLWQLRSGQVASQAAEAVNHIGNHNTACK